MVKPILFNTEMVQAILDGRKTVTRRLVKAKSKNACGFYVTFRKSDNAFMGVYDYDENEGQFDNPQTQPAYPGDILYVRETWMDYAGRIMYKADCDKYRLDSLKLAEFKWHPSIHMPKEAARIFLKVKDVRVELWNSTIKKSDLDLYGWDADPWVWVIEFERCEKPKIEE